MKSQAFTFIETLITISIIILLTVLTIPAFNHFQSELVLNNNSQEIISTLRLAQSKTIASEAEDSWGVYFTVSSYTLFKGASFSERDLNYDKLYTISKKAELYDFSLNNSGSEIVFERITGATQDYGSISLRLKTEHDKMRQVYISDLGQIQFSELTIPDDAARKKDSRHVHFDYSRQINTATEKLILVFDNNGSPVQQEISIASNLKNGQFFWQGEIMVGSVVQSLTIQTLWLNNPSTRFCFQRGQDNNKAFEVDLSGDPAISPDLVSYDIQGLTAVKGNSTFVSNVSSQ